MNVADLRDYLLTMPQTATVVLRGPEGVEGEIIGVVYDQSLVFIDVVLPDPEEDDD